MGSSKRNGSALLCLLLAGLLLLAVTAVKVEAGWGCVDRCVEGGGADAYACSFVCIWNLRRDGGTGAGSWARMRGEILPVELKGEREDCIERCMDLGLDFFECLFHVC